MRKNHHLIQNVLKELVFAVAVISIVFFIKLTGYSTVRLAAQSTIPVHENINKSDSAHKFKVILLGSGLGPRIDLRQFGPSILIEAAAQRLLFDCGRGATIRMAQMGIPHGSINKLFLTHLHSDHVIQLPDLLLTGWVGGGRNMPLEVWGPDGTSDMMDHLLRAFAFDIKMRRDIDEKVPGDGIRVINHNIKEGIVFEEHGIKVTAFLVDHSPVTPAYGYRIDYNGHSVVLSGDTRVSENLIRFAQGTDVLIHEVLDAETLRKWFPDNPKAAAAILAKHTTPEEAGKVFSKIQPRLAIYSHAPNTEQVIMETRKTYKGPLQGAEDMLTIEVGEKINIRRFAQ
jgi:ribonuclease Z